MAKKRIKMEKSYPNRQQALDVLLEFVKKESLIRHALAVESVMLHFAELLREDDKEKWGIIGLVHDIDYEMYPDRHCKKVREILEARNWPEEYIHSIESHGWKLCTDVEPVENLEKVLYTIDELTGLIAATALVRPSKSILDLDSKSVMKKWKQKGFAEGVNRSIIEEGAKMLGMELNAVIDETIQGMRKVADEIGLRGLI
jgi:putative nucleotidyltransferase with HDIG domain